MSNSSPLPKYQRTPKDVKFILTDRDMEILNALNEYRYLKTSQIHRLVFPDNTSNQSTRRRLKYLYHHHYIGRITPYVQLGKPAPEIAYHLDKEGIHALKQHGQVVRLSKKVSKVKHQFLQHALDLSDFRIRLVKALEKTQGIELEQFIPDFETKANTDKSVGRKRYKLYADIAHHVNRKTYVVYPDALIHLMAEGKLQNHNMLYFLEIDRGTEGLERIREKLIGYNLYLNQNIYKKYGDFQGFKVLIQTSSPKRANNIRNALLDQAGADMVLVTDIAQVNEETLLHDDIWVDHEGNKKSLLKKQKPS